jgi:hypothetical protein
LLTGFLLTLPFQQRFGILDTTMRVIYLVTVGCSIGATVLLEARWRCTACYFAGIELKLWSRPHTGSVTPAYY